MWGLKDMESMSSSHLLIELGPLLTRSPTGCCTGGWGSQSVMAGAVKGPGHSSWAVATCGFLLAPCIWGPSLVYIASDSLGLPIASPFWWGASRVGALILLRMASWRGSFLRLYFLFITGELCIPRIHSLLVLSGVRALTSRLSSTRRAQWGHLNTQHFVLLPKSPCLAEQGLHLTLALALVFFYTLAPVEVVFTTHG